MNPTNYNPSLALPGEVPLKQFCLDEAAKDGVGYHAIFVRIRRGKYPTLGVRHVNSRVVFVVPPKPINIPVEFV